MIFNREGNRYKLCVIGDLNEWDGREDIRDVFGVPGEYENGRKAVDFCAE